MPPDRRQLLISGLATGLAGPAFAAPAGLAELEQRIGGRMGVYALDLASGRSFGWRAAERFPLCSTFKVLLAGAVLARVEAGEEQLDRMIAYGQADMVFHAPVTGAHLAEESLSVGALCKAAVQVSDNPAANLLLKTLGGPEGLTAFVRTLGDRTTRLDRFETELNSAVPGDPRDTTSPAAMVGSLRALLAGRALGVGARHQLAAWMEGASTGPNRLRRGAPPGWRSGDKTGSGAYETVNDVAYLWPPEGPPVLVACYTTQGAAPLVEREAVMAEIGRRAADLTMGRG